MIDDNKQQLAIDHLRSVALGLFTSDKTTDAICLLINKLESAQIKVRLLEKSNQQLESRNLFLDARLKESQRKLHNLEKASECAAKLLSEANS